ncbi:MAG TPA: dTDP-4-dehydrorhamnose 3,5-epimerase [Candidatus Acidoferrales bacterium]
MRIATLPCTAYRPPGLNRDEVRSQIPGIAAEQESNRVQKISTALPEVWELQPKVFRDARGFFLETYHQQKFADLGIHDVFVQDNHSSSAKGTLRGLHFQLRHAQAKLCRVVKGEALDVAVDVRLGSPTFGKWTSVLLSEERHNEFFVPQGFAHGFVALSDSVQFLYKCSDIYDPASEYGIIWNDPDIAIDWGIANPLVSEKDSKYSTLASLPRELLPRYPAK